MNFYETEVIELKRKVDKDFARKVVAFLNTAGGTIYVGIDDKTRKPVGITNIDEEMKKISNCINDQIYPKAINFVSIITFKDDEYEVIEVNIKKSNTLHHLKEYGLTPKGTPIRFGTELREMSEKEISERSFVLLRDKLGIANIPAKNQKLEFQVLKYLFSEKGLTINDEQFVNNIPGIRLADGTYSMLGELLADTNNIRILVVIFQGNDKTVFSRRTSFGGTCLIDTYKKVLSYCQDVINDVIVIKHNKSLTNVGRYEERRFNDEAFEEAWLNAVTYNDWVSENPPIIYVFENRIEIHSVGGLPEGLSVDEFYKGKSRHRSKELFDLFDRLGLGEHTGHGVPLILSKYNNDKSIFEFDENSISVTFKYPDIVTKELKKNRINVQDGGINGGINGGISGGINIAVKLSDNAQSVLKIILDDYSITTNEISKLANISKRSVERSIRELRNKNIIIRVGSVKTGSWKIL